MWFVNANAQQRSTCHSKAFGWEGECGNKFKTALTFTPRSSNAVSADDREFTIAETWSNNTKNYNSSAVVFNPKSQQCNFHSIPQKNLKKFFEKLFGRPFLTALYRECTVSRESALSLMLHRAEIRHCKGGNDPEDSVRSNFKILLQLAPKIRTKIRTALNCGDESGRKQVRTPKPGSFTSRARRSGLH